LWEGETETFQKLARLNLQMLRDSGARRIVTHCPECARTLKVDYPKLVGDHGMEVLHLSELLDQPEYRSRLEPSGPAGRAAVTFHDPCRLGRHLQVYDPPRRLLQGQGFVVQEMMHHRGNSVCCGTSGWTACGRVSKQIQLERLQEARATGVGMLVTACLKCQIHLRCAMADSDQDTMPVRDLATVVAENL
jgi:Fe-S oxidoreductase